ncbi:hypothetical protein DSO57_1038436, partial [Entomophthora muscae]
MSNLTNAQEAVQHYLDKKDLKEGLQGKEGDGVRNDNYFPLETQALEHDSNPDPDLTRTSSPCFSGVEPCKL